MRTEVVSRKPVGAAPRRRRGAAATREAILEAAARRFAAEGYERAGAREIAADAGVTAALVNRYFGSKENLFAEVLERTFDITVLLPSGPADLAEHLARIAVYGREGARDKGQTPLMLLLQCATEPRAAEMLRAHLDRNHVRQLSERINADAAPVRAAVLLGLLTGACTMHRLLRPEALTESDPEQLVAILTHSLAACIGRTGGKST